ncbi:MAG TPA: hypothetical protein VMU05_18390 [Dongiaceae bacterium]|nr:hypothetical protein [Dongiaceae bacterium]
MLRIFLLFFLATGPQLFSQQATSSPPADLELPDAPSAIRQPYDSTVASSSKPASTLVRPAELSIQDSKSKPPRVVDRQFLLLSALNFGAMIADIEMTQYKLSPTVREGNPLFGSHPSREMMYEMSLPVVFATTMWSRQLKKNAPHSKRWMIVPIVGASVHTAAVIWNAHY